MEVDLKQKVDLLPRCRLCLQWTEANDGLERYGDVFVENGDLSLKIRDCVGVFIRPDDSIRTVCANCQQTVRLVDDFRLLCRQTEEIYESVRVRCEDEIKWDRYKTCVDELRALVQQHKDVVKGHLVDCDVGPEATGENLVSNPFVPILEVKDEMDFEEEYDPQQMVEQVVEIKPEFDSGHEQENDEDSATDLDITKRTLHKRIPMSLKLAVAQEVERHPTIWDTTLARSIRSKGKAWQDIGQKFNTDGKTMRKQHWHSLVSFYRTNKMRRSDQLESDEKLHEFMQIMQKIVKGRSEADDDADYEPAPEQDKEESENEETGPSRGTRKSAIFALTTPSKRMQLAKLVHEHELIWNRQHADFNAAFTKEEVWSQIAKQMKVTRDEVKYGWKCLRDLYRGRMKRVIKGELDREARLLQDPLFKLLDRMCAANMRIGGVKALVQHKTESNDDTTEAPEEEESSAHFDQQDQSEGETEEAIESTIEIKEEDVTAKTSAEPSSYDLQLKFAQKMLERMNEPDFPKHDPSSLWKQVAEKLQLDLSIAKTRWNVMKANYKDNRRRIVTAGIIKRVRMQECLLFNLMNHIVPKLEGSEPYVAPQTDDKIIERQKLPIRLKIAIAEEIKKNPEIWDTSLASSTHTIEKAWSNIASKFETDVTTIRHHWGSLQTMYRFHTKRKKDGVLLRNDSDQKYRKLIGVLRYIREPKEDRQDVDETSEVDAPVEEEQGSDSEAEIGEVDVECQLRDKAPKLAELALASDLKKMELAQFVHQHEFLWNHKHPDFGNLVLKDHTWDIAAATMNVTRDDIKYGWKCLRDLYRGRMKRVISGKLSNTASLLRDPLFQLLDVMCADNMKIGAQSATPKAAAGENESASNNAGDDNEDEFSVKFDNTVKMKLISLIEQYELIWNSEHSEHLNLEKRDHIWDAIAEQMNFSKATVKALWIRLRNVFRGRKLRLLKGQMHANSPLLREPVYVKLHALLDGHMQLGKFSNGKHQLSKSTKPKKSAYVETDKIEAGPFGTMEEKVKLVQEVMKHELLWNSNHDDYFRSDLRGAAWRQIAAQLQNCEEHECKNMWRRLRNMHRPRKSRSVHQIAWKSYSNDDDDTEPIEAANNPLYALFSKMAGSLTGDGDISQDPPKIGKRKLQEVTETFMTHKRRFTEKKYFDDEGCIKVKKGGSVRYEKVCELCGKQVERSMFEYHMNQHNGLKPYECSYPGCGRQYSNKVTRDRHELLIHCEDNYKYTCDQCEEKFKHRSTFNYHYAVKHQSQMVPCPICGKLLKHKSLIREHVRRHTGQFPCPVCGKILQKKYSLDVHMRTHTQEKPYFCELCGQRFMLKVQLKTHLSKVHSLTWEQYAANYGDSGGLQQQ